MGFKRLQESHTRDLPMKRTTADCVAWLSTEMLDPGPFSSQQKTGPYCISFTGIILFTAGGATNNKNCDQVNAGTAGTHDS